MYLLEIFVYIIMFWIREIIREFSNRLELRRRSNQQINNDLPSPSSTISTSIPTSSISTSIPTPSLPCTTLATIETNQQTNYEIKREAELKAIFAKIDAENKEREQLLETIRKLNAKYGMIEADNKISNELATTNKEMKATNEMDATDAKYTIDVAQTVINRNEVATTNTEMKAANEMDTTDTECTIKVSPTVMSTPSISSSPNNSSNDENDLQTSNVFTSVSILSTKEKVMLVKQELETKLVIKRSCQSKTAFKKVNSLQTTPPVEAIIEVLPPDAIKEVSTPPVEAIKEVLPSEDSVEVSPEAITELSPPLEAIKDLSPPPVEAIKEVSPPEEDVEVSPESITEISPPVPMPPVETKVETMPPVEETSPVANVETSEIVQDFNINMDDLSSLFSSLKFDDTCSSNSENNEEFGYDMVELTSLFSSLKFEDTCNSEDNEEFGYDMVELNSLFSSLKFEDTCNSEDNEEFDYNMDALNSLFGSISLSSLPSHEDSESNIGKEDLILQPKEENANIEKESEISAPETSSPEITTLVTTLTIKESEQEFCISFGEIQNFETIPNETVPLENVPIDTVPLENVPVETSPLETTPVETSIPPEVTSSTLEVEVEQEAIINEEIDQKENHYTAQHQERESIAMKMVAAANNKAKNGNRAEIQSIYGKIQEDIAVSRKKSICARFNQFRATSNIQPFAESDFKKYISEANKNENLD